MASGIGKRSPGGQPGGGARRSRLRKPPGGGQTLRHLRGQRNTFLGQEPSKRVCGWSSGAAQPFPYLVPPFPGLTPSRRPHSGSALPTPAGLRTPQNCKTSESEQENRNDRSEKELHIDIAYLLALLKPAEDQSAFNRCSARSRRKEEVERLPWYKVLWVGGGGGEGVGRSGPVFPPRLLIQN